MKAPPTWLVPIAVDISPYVHSTSANLTAAIRLDDRICVELGTDRPGGPLLVMSPLEACQLGQALLEASKESAARRAKAGRR